MSQYDHLRNGSDIRGIALPDTGKEVTLTPEACTAIGRGFGRYLFRRAGRPVRVVLGRDCRLSGEKMLAWLAQGLCETGMQVTDVGPATTPAMFYATVMEPDPFEAAVMVTASHLPFERNGYKFFYNAEGLGGADVKEILALAEGEETTGLPAGTVEPGEILAPYAASLRTFIQNSLDGGEQPLSGLHIVTDAGNGMGGFYATHVLRPLGADISGSVYLEPDGRFPNHVPNPENAEAMRSISRAVMESKADFGLIFDTDVDRAGAVLPDGSELNRNRLIAAISAILLREHPGTAIVTDSITSTGLTDFIRSRGGVHCRYRRGYRNVIDKAKELNAAGIDCQLAIETSGHAALAENRFQDDGAYLMTRFVIELTRCRREGRDFSSLIAGLRECAEEREFRMALTVPDFIPAGQRVLDGLAASLSSQPGWRAEEENYEGIRVNLDAAHGSGWFLLRLSLHEPLLALNIESDLPGGVRTIAAQLFPILSAYSYLDVSSMDTYLREE